MVSNEIYDELKILRESRDLSTSEVIKDLIKDKNSKGKNLMKFLGALKGDREYDNIMKGLKREWSSWQKRYA